MDLLKILIYFYIENNIDYISLIRIDTDTYSPAKVILSNLKEFLVKETIIIFDEFCGYPNWKVMNSSIK